MTMSASEFIRSLPTKIPASEAIAAGEKAGVKFSESLVYQVRSREKKKRKNANINANTKRQKPTLRVATNMDLESKIRPIIDRFVTELMKSIRFVVIETISNGLERK